MIAWTPAARAELDRHWAAARDRLVASGADLAEVRDDLQRHVEEEALARGLTTLTVEDVRSLLARLGPAPDPGPADPSPGTTPAPAPPPSRPASVWLGLGGVVLPAITLAVELATAMCAATFFDALPTLWHLLIAALVPVVNGVSLSHVIHRNARHRRALGWLNGLAIGSAAWFTLLFVPLLFPGVVTLVFFGAGLLPLTPLLSLLSTLALRRHLRALGCPTPSPRLPGLWPGMAAAIVALLLASSSSWVTRLCLQQAIAEDAPTRARGLAWLRAIGSEDALLRACYGRSSGAEDMDVFNWVFPGARRVSTDEAREVYYRVTGRPFNAVPAPDVRTARGRFLALDEWTWDRDQGGERVGGRLRGLTLHSSRLDAIVEPAAALAYYEWILEFKNVAARAQEARAQLLLPAGGVVSRLTLWVNGEEREAAFAGRSQVRQAYQEVAIQQRRDPVLVTTAGPDRVLMQCFPVPAEGGLMRVRLGITAPLRRDAPETGILTWPCFLERNFTIPEDLRHAVWAEWAGSPAIHPDATLRTETPRPGFAAARGSLRDEQLPGGAAEVAIPRPAETRHVWTPDTRPGMTGVIHGTLTNLAKTPPPRVVLVLDGSAPIAAHLRNAAAALDALPSPTEVAVILAGDAVEDLAPPAVLDAAARARLQGRIRTLKAAGGRDNLPALTRAWDVAAERAGSVVLWVHAAQPVLLSSPDSLLQAFARRPGGPPIIAIPMDHGPNRILERLDGLPGVRGVPVPADGLGLEGLRRTLGQIVGTMPAPSLELRREPGSTPPPPEATQASPHLARLWAEAEVRRLLAARDSAGAVALAAHYQLVTPCSGAVVLETQAQYDRHGLEPVDAASVPAIPEPSPAALFVLAGALLLICRRRGSRVCRNERNESELQSD